MRRTIGLSSILSTMLVLGLVACSGHAIVRVVFAKPRLQGHEGRIAIGQLLFVDGGDVAEELDTFRGAFDIFDASEQELNEARPDLAMTIELFEACRGY